MPAVWVIARDMPPPPKITYTEAEFGEFLYELSHAPYGQKHSLMERFALDHDLAVSTVGYHVRRYKSRRNITGPLNPGDVPEPAPVESADLRSALDREVNAAGDVFAFTSDEALVLLALEGRRYLTLAEIAEWTGLPPKRVWHAVHRLLNYKRVMPAIERICTVTRGTRPTFKVCYNL